MKNVAYEFLSRFRGGVSQSNRYKVSFFLPRGVKLNGGELGVNTDALSGKITQMQNYFNSKEQINVKCHSASMPGRNMMTFDHRMNGAPFKIPYSASYSPSNFSFYADSNYDSRDFFDVWQSAVNNLPTNTMNFMDEFVSDVTIMALDKQGKETYGVTLFEAWPVDIAEVQLSYADLDSPTVITVGLEYNYWSPKWASQGKNGIVS